MKYREKPVTIDAYQTDKKVIVETLEGPLYAVPGDYIITGVSGEKYPCKPDIFKKTYEPVEELRTRKCKLCGMEFMPKTNSQYYCSAECAFKVLTENAIFLDDYKNEG